MKVEKISYPDMRELASKAMVTMHTEEYTILIPFDAMVEYIVAATVEMFALMDETEGDIH